MSTIDPALDTTPPETAAAEPPAGGLTLGLSAGYGLGSLAFGVAATVLSGSVLQLYFNQVIGLPAAWVGTAIMATIIIDSIVDPLIGRFSDRLRTPWGRRHVLMYASAVPSGLGVYLMWQAPASWAPATLLAFMIAMLLFVRIATSFFEVPARALAPELAPGYHDRTILIAWRFVFLIGGGAILNAILYQVYLREDAANPLGVLNRERYADFGLLAAFIIVAAIVISSLATHGRIRDLHVPPERGTTLGEAFGELKLAFANPRLVSLLFATMLNGFGGGLWFGLYAYIALNFWALTPQEFSYVLLASPFSALVSLFIAPRVSTRMGKRAFMMTCYFGWLILFSTPFLGKWAGLMPEGGLPLVAALVGFTFVELTFAYGVHTVLNSMLTDATDDVAARTGRRSEGVMFAVYGLLDKWGIALGAFAAGLVLAFIAFPTGAMPGTVDPAIVTALVLCSVPAVAACNMIAMVLISQFRIDEAQHQRNLATLRAQEG
ncbi:MAG: MFS transporter [Alphaproteobacteria bacterium]|nr:MFS transporter [Alphaproteobacteria bacterium]